MIKDRTIKSQRFWIVSEVFYPDETSTAYIMTEIAKALSSSTDVHVLCGPSGYSGILSNSTNLEGVTIHRIGLFNFNKNNPVSRSLRLLLIAIGMFLFTVFKINKEDKVLLGTNPAFLIPLIALVKKIKGFNLNILVHDVFPENLIPAGIIKSEKNVFYFVLKKIFDWGYRTSDKLIALGQDMKDVLNRKILGVVPIVVIENWADMENVKPLPFKENKIVVEHGLENKIIFLFAGNIGRVQGLDFLFDIMASVTNKYVHFIFIGNGAMLDRFKNQATFLRMDNVSFLGEYPRSSQSLFLNACHFGVVTLDDRVYGLGVPSKSYNILAAGKPILFLGNSNSEISRMVRELNCGLAFNTNQQFELLKFLNELDFDTLPFVGKENELRNIVENKFSKRIVLNKFKRELEIANQNQPF